MMCSIFEHGSDSIVHSARQPRNFGCTSKPKSRGLENPLLNPNPADFLDRGILVSEWTQIPRIFSTDADILNRGILVSEWTPNPVDFLERGILVSEWTQIPRIFSTAGFWCRSAEPESRWFSQPRYYGLGVNPNPADFVDRGILVSECWTRIPGIFSTAGFWSRSEPRIPRSFTNGSVSVFVFLLFRRAQSSLFHLWVKDVQSKWRWWSFTRSFWHKIPRSRKSAGFGFSTPRPKSRGLENPRDMGSLRHQNTAV
jgi:hypothetical protein